MRSPWLKLSKKTHPELPLEPPIRLGNMSNGEFFHEQTRAERRTKKLILERADENARRLGIDRREFLASAMGMATSLSVLNMVSGCGSNETDSGSGGSSGSSGDGGYVVPDGATLDCEQAEDVLDTSDLFIFDIQTHHIEEDGPWRKTNPGSGEALANFFASISGCALPNTIDCVDARAYLEKIFVESDTTVAVLSGFPAPLCTPERTSGCGAAIDNDQMARSRDHVNAIARSQRVVQHCQVNPNDRLDLPLAIMDRIHAEYGVAGWKVYPPWGPEGPGWFLDDEAVGIPFIEKARALDVKVICIHKGIVFPGWDATTADPRDVGVVAKLYPDTKFIVYHSAIEFGGGAEGPYNAANPAGIDRLIKTVHDNGLGEGSNVYAELGSVWAQVMNDPVAAQHVIGKLLANLGEDNVLWGSECIWFGSPQPQIQAFQAFQISTQFQEDYGYPALTPAIKSKIFGRSAAAIYGIDPDATRCRIRSDDLAMLKRARDDELGAGRFTLHSQGGPRTRREFLRYASFTGGKPG